MLKHFIHWSLGVLTRCIIKKYRPRIVAITGSVGKTSAKAAVAAVLRQRFRVGFSEKNFNNELGVPLTVLQCDAPGRSPLAWVGVYVRGLWLLCANDPLFPQVLVLEMGADHPGDIAHLMKIAPPDIGIVTAVSAAHTEFFGSVADVLNEKKRLVVNLPADKLAIINADDPLLVGIIPEITAHYISFGGADQATVRSRAIQLSYTDDGRLLGTEARVVCGDEEFDISIPGVAGEPVVNAALVGAAVGNAMKLSNTDIQNGLMHFCPPAGRMTILGGIKKSLIIDDTYNSSPRAAEAALRALANISGVLRRIAVLGDMRELGALTESMHREIGRLVFELGIDLLVTVGASARFIADEARTKGMSEDSIFSFDASPEAGMFVQERMHEGDLILVKGSQGVRCEKIVKEIMADPLQAEKLLVRQDPTWI